LICNATVAMKCKGIWSGILKQYKMLRKGFSSQNLYVPQKCGIWRCSCNTAVHLHQNQNPGQLLLSIASVTSLLHTRNHSKMAILWRKPFSRQQIAFLNISKTERRSWKLLKWNFPAIQGMRKNGNVCGGATEEVYRRVWVLFHPLWQVDWYAAKLCLFIRMVLTTWLPKKIYSPLCQVIPEKRIFLMLLWALLKRQNCRSPIDVGDIATKVKSLFDLENSSLGDMGMTMGERGEQFPSSRITVGGAGLFQQCHNYFQYSKLLPKKTQVRTRSAKLDSCPGRHLTQLRLCLAMSFWHCKMTLRSKLDQHLLSLVSM